MKTTKTVIVLVMMAASILFSARHAYAEDQSRDELEDENTFQGAAYFIHYDDGSFNWYQGDSQFGQAALNAAQSGLQSISRLMPLDLAQPIEVFIYANADDLRSTLDPGGE